MIVSVIRIEIKLNQDEFSRLISHKDEPLRNEGKDPMKEKALSFVPGFDFLSVDVNSYELRFKINGQEWAGYEATYTSIYNLITSYIGFFK